MSDGKLRDEKRERERKNDRNEGEKSHNEFYDSQASFDPLSDLFILNERMSSQGSTC